MTLQAHTNAVGTHSSYRHRLGYVRGSSDYDMDNVYTQYEYPSVNQSIEWERSVKPATVHGDRSSVYPYSRKVRKVISDEPYQSRSRLFGGSHLIYDEIVDHYISVLHTPFIYDPGNGGQMENSKAEADVKALNNLNQAKAQLGADLAQVRQTVDMFSGNVSQLARSLLAAKRGQWGSIPGILGLDRKSVGSGKTASNRWLEYIYGWLPLMGSIHDVQQVLHEELIKNRLLKARGYSRYKTETGFPYRQENWEARTSARLKTQLVARHQSPDKVRMNSFGLINPAAIAWELVPWSFAIDWFVPVGGTLEAITATYGLDFVKGFQTRHHDYQLISRADTETYGYDGYDGLISSGFYEERGYDFEREVYYDFPPARLYADTTPFSTTRAINALALVRQLFR